MCTSLRRPHYGNSGFCRDSYSSQKRNTRAGMGISPNDLVEVLFPNVHHDSLLATRIFAVTKYLTKILKGYCGLQYQGAVRHGQRSNRCDETGHTASVVRKQRAVSAGARLPLSFLLGGGGGAGQTGLPSQLKPSQACSETCLLGVSRSCQLDNINHPNQ